MVDTKKFIGIHTPNFKQVVEFGKDPNGSEDVTMMSIDTGISGNLFGGNYFDMNENHRKGNLYKMETNFKILEKGGVDKSPLGHILKINPL